MSYVDLSFGATGQVVPRDHGYALYGALSRLLPGVHGAKWLAIQGLVGPLVGTGGGTGTGSLRIRVSSDRLVELLPLVGATVDINGSAVTIGAPTVFPLRPVAMLDARLVVIRLTGGIPKPFVREEFERRFLAEAQRQLVAHGIAGDIELSGRQSLRVGGQRVLGHSVRVSGLSAEDSLNLQIHGLGGKRTMGCGIFRPARIAVKAVQAA